ETRRSWVILHDDVLMVGGSNPSRRTLPNAAAPIVSDSIPPKALSRRSTNAIPIARSASFLAMPAAPCQVAEASADSRNVRRIAPRRRPGTTAALPLASTPGRGDNPDHRYDGSETCPA